MTAKAFRKASSASCRASSSRACRAATCKDHPAAHYLRFKQFLGFREFAAGVRDQRRLLPRAAADVQGADAAAAVPELADPRGGDAAGGPARRARSTAAGAPGAPAMAPDPAAEYRSRLAAPAGIRAVQRLDARLAGARLVVFGAAVAAARAGVVCSRVERGGSRLRPWPFCGACRLARPRAPRAGARRRGHRRSTSTAWPASKTAGPACGPTGDAFRDHRHPYAADLDLFGPASLFELLSLARTHPGEATLAGWLKTAADPDEIAARQAGGARADAGARLARAPGGSTGFGPPARWNPALLLAWAEAPPGAQPPWASRGRWRSPAVTLLAALYVGHHRLDHAAPASCWRCSRPSRCRSSGGCAACCTAPTGPRAA